jgi:hypothetical protein
MRGHRRINPPLRGARGVYKNITMIKVLGIKIVDRIKEAGLTQEILSRYSGIITTRLGFHEVTDNVCSREAYIILHLKDDKAESDKLAGELEPLGGIVIREMIFVSPDKDNGRKDEEGAAEIIGILVPRDDEVVKSVQKLLTSYGCSIRTRLGVNEVFYGEKAGLIILELTGDNQQRELLERDLKANDQVRVRKMVF